MPERQISYKHWPTSKFFMQRWKNTTPISVTKQHIIFPLLFKLLQIPCTYGVLLALQMPNCKHFFEDYREIKAFENEQLSDFMDLYSTFQASGKARREKP